MANLPEAPSQDHIEVVPDCVSRNEEERDDDEVSVRSEARGDDLPEGYFLSFRFIGMVVGFALCALSANMFVIMPTNILSYINEDIGPSPYIAWVNIARTLSLSFAYTIMGRLSDLFGRRWFYLLGNIVSLLGIIVSATAQNVNSLIVGAAVCGLGETVQLSFNVALGELVPNKYRPAILSFVFLTNSPFTTFGPILARHFVSNPNMGWRYCYFINIACTSLGVVLLFFCYHPPTFALLHERKTKRQILAQLDYVGIFLWTAGLTSFLMGVSWGGSIYPWKSVAPITAIVLGVCLLVTLFLYETYMKLEYPAIPVKLFPNRGFMSLVCCATIATMFYYSALLLWPQQIAKFFTSDITYAGWLSCTVASATVLGQICAGGIIRWAGNVRYWLIFSACAMCAFVGGLAALTPQRKALGIAFTLLGPFFVGFIELSSLALAPLFCKAADIGVASGLLASIRSAGGSVSVAIYVAILNNRLATTLPANIGPVAIQAGLPRDQVAGVVAAVEAGTLAKLPGLTPEILAAVNKVIPTAYSQAFKTVYLSSLAFGGVAILGSLFSKDVQKHLTDKVERKMHGKVEETVGKVVEKE